MPIKEILLRGGTDQDHTYLVAKNRELTVDTEHNTLVLQDGGIHGYKVAKVESVATKLSDLSGSEQLWTRETLTKMSDLQDDTGNLSGLTRISQLVNNLNFKTAHCTYCDYCSYCALCSQCNQVQCNQVKCNEVQCSKCTDCSAYCSQQC